METQLELFHKVKHIPDWLAVHFYKANAGNYPGKNDFYSLLKPAILSHGEFIGYELQIIKKKCFTCFGTGTYKQYRWEYGERYLIHKEPCRNCTNGIYYTKKVTLMKFNLNGNVYHIPLPELKNDVQYIGEINGLVTHENIPGDEAYRSFLILLWKYNKPMFYQKSKEFLSKEFVKYFKWIPEFMQKCIRKDNNSDDLPF